MKKLTPEERNKKRWERFQKTIRAKPILGMCTHRSGDPDIDPKSKPENPVWRMQIIKLGKSFVEMKMINGKGTMRISAKKGEKIENVCKIELVPCDLTPSVTIHGDTREIPQDSDVPM